MARILLVLPGAGSPELLALEAWQALMSVPAFASPGEELATRLRQLGYEVGELVEAGPLQDEPARGGLPLLHSHAAIPEGARALAGRLVELAAERGEIAFIGGDEAVTRALTERGMAGEVEVEFVMGRVPRGHALIELVSVMARLRGPGGCPWDAEQTHQTLAEHLLEEAYELLEAIESGDEEHIAEELGDVLLQVVFHAQMGTDADVFDIDDVARGLIDKLVRRHPHVFGEVEVSGPQEVVRNWDRIKHKEKGRRSAADGIPEALPALAYAQKIQRRAASFALGDLVDPRVAGALSELESASESQREAALGELLLSVVALARSLDLDAETALRRAARLFRDRVVDAERRARETES
ncbi:MAG: nucleoside triphosphate pyrophosphohydrolase [Actinomycetota bacterium]